MFGGTASFFGANCAIVVANNAIVPASSAIVGANCEGNGVNKERVGALWNLVVGYRNESSGLRFFNRYISISSPRFGRGEGRQTSRNGGTLN